MKRYILPPYYQKYRWMVDITANPNHPEYPRYGAKGIACAWNNGEYRDFYYWLVSTLGEQPTPQHQLCRKDKTGHFEPRNLQWMLPKERSNTNTRQNKLVTYKRQTKTISQWAEETSIPYYTLRRRLADGKTMKEIIKEFASS